MELQHRGVVVEPTGKRLGEVEQPRAILDRAVNLGVAVDGGLIGEPGAPRPRIQGYGDRNE